MLESRSISKGSCAFVTLVPNQPVTANESKKSTCLISKNSYPSGVKPQAHMCEWFEYHQEFVFLRSHGYLGTDLAQWVEQATHMQKTNVEAQV